MAFYQCINYLIDISQNPDFISQCGFVYGMSEEIKINSILNSPLNCLLSSVFTGSIYSWGSVVVADCLPNKLKVFVPVVMFIRMFYRSFLKKKVVKIPPLNLSKNTHIEYKLPEVKDKVEEEYVPVEPRGTLISTIHIDSEDKKLMEKLKKRYYELVYKREIEVEDMELMDELGKSFNKREVEEDVEPKLKNMMKMKNLTTKIVQIFQKIRMTTNMNRQVMKMKMKRKL